MTWQIVQLKLLTIPVCNRYAIQNPDSMERWIKETLDPEFVEIIRKIGIKYTASPTNELPVVVPTEAGKPRVRAMKWGVWFTKGDGTRSGPYMNAKKELALKNWRESVQTRRCVVPADAFFEWPPEPPKTPWMFRRPENQPFAFAGIYTRGSSEGLDTFAFLTTEPNAFTASISHPRSPVILTEQNACEWIKSGELSTAEIEAFAVPFAGPMTKHRVTMRMNRSGYNEPDAVRPLTPEEIAAEAGKTKIVSAERPNGDQLSLF